MAPLEQRDVLLLRLLAGLTIDEIATVLGKTNGAVKAPSEPKNRGTR